MNIRTSIATLLIAGTLGTTAHAADGPSRQENVGLGSGLVIGALAGGPFGALAGAAAGAWLGDHYSKSEKQRMQLERDVSAGTAQNAEFAARLAEAGRLDAERAQVNDRYEHLVAGLHRLESDVPFKTNEAVLSTAATEHLRVLGTVLAGLPQAKVRVSGFADPRGTEAGNMGLSKRRADAVVAVLSQAGVRTDQLVIDARGASEAPPDATTLDDYALERRASVRLEPGSDAMSAQR